MERAGNRFETPVFFRLSFFDYVKMNMLAFSKVKYEADRWYKVDVLMDWDLEVAAFFIDGEFKANTLFFSQERDI